MNLTNDRGNSIEKDFTTMFWNFNSTSSSQIEAILAKENVTLQELMDEEDIINACKLQNKTVMDFLTRPEIIEELVTLTTIEPSTELDEHVRFKYSNIACEILTCDVPALNEKLASDENLLAKLYVFLDNEPPLNPLLASFFSKIMGVLIAKKTEQNWLSYQFTCLQVLDFLKAKENFVSLLLKHLGTSAIMDLTLKIMTQVEGVEVRQNILNWLDSQRIMQTLVSLLDSAVEKERHDNVAQLLCDFIKIARDNQRNSTTERNDPDPLLNTLESPETVSLLLEHMLGDNKTESCIVGGIHVLLAILDVTSVSFDEASDVERRQAIIESTTLAVLKRLPDFHALLLEPPKKAPIITTVGVLDPPLGNTRLQVTRLLAAVISTNNAELMKELISLGTLQVLLDLFFEFPWNNFLHTQVQVCITSALKGAHSSSNAEEDNALCRHLIVHCKLIERILEAWKNNDVQQLETKGVRQGYMGHLTNIATSIEDLCSSGPLGQFLKDNVPKEAESFSQFSETTLQDMKNTREILLGGAHPNTINEDSDEYGDVPFTQSSVLHQQMFTQYQMHHFSSQFIENYGFNDDEFSDRDDTLQNIDHRTGMNFDLAEGDLVQQHELFKQMCAQNINTLDDADDQIFEDREHTFQTVIEKPTGRHDAVFSSDSEDDSPPQSPPVDDPFMDVDPWSSSNKGSESAVAPVSKEDPWNSPKEKTASEANTGWANFNSAAFANFEAGFRTAANATTSAPNSVQVELAETDLKVENVEETDGAKESPVENNVSGPAVGENAAREITSDLKENAAAGDQTKMNALLNIDEKCKLQHTGSPSATSTNAESDQRQEV